MEVYARARPEGAEGYYVLGRTYHVVSKNDPGFAEPYANWRVLPIAQGNYSEARRMLEKALQVRPYWAEPRRLLKMLETKSSR
jgi:hypothetical protein